MLVCLWRQPRMQWNRAPTSFDEVETQTYVRDGLARVVRWCLLWCGRGQHGEVDQVAVRCLGITCRTWYFAKRLTLLSALNPQTWFLSFARDRRRWHQCDHWGSCPDYGDRFQPFW